MSVNFFHPGILLILSTYHVASNEIDHHPSWQYLPTTNCGEGSLADRIVGGKQAGLGQFPWLARIGYKIKPDVPKIFYLCAGSLISGWYVITAVHCTAGVMGDAMFSVRLGENYIRDEIDCDGDICAPPTQDIKIEEVFKYKNYLGAQGVNYGDIALIRMTKEVEFTDYVQPICLPRGDLIDNLDYFLIPGNTTVEVAGWGIINSIGSLYPDKLMYVKMPLVPLSDCQQSYASNKIDESQICVGVGDGKDSCVGDSGGPLMKAMAVNSSPRYYLLGIVSYGMKWCGVSSAVYTNVTHYMNWILDRIQE